MKCFWAIPRISMRSHILGHFNQRHPHRTLPGSVPSVHTTCQPSSCFLYMYWLTNFSPPEGPKRVDRLVQGRGTKLEHHCGLLLPMLCLFRSHWDHCAPSQDSQTPETQFSMDLAMLFPIPAWTLQQPSRKGCWGKELGSGWCQIEREAQDRNF